MFCRNLFSLHDLPIVLIIEATKLHGCPSARAKVVMLIGSHSCMYLTKMQVRNSICLCFKWWTKRWGGRTKTSASPDLLEMNSRMLQLSSNPTKEKS